MAILQVREIDDNLYESLKRLARREHRSLSQEVIRILKAYISNPHRMNIDNTEEFLALCGSWDDKRSTEEIVKDIRQNRKNNRRFGGKNGLFD